MDKGALGFIILCSLSVIIAFFLHKKIKNYILACVVASIISSIIYQIIGIFVVGYLDPFFLIALLYGAAVAFIIAIIVGFPFIYSRKNRHKHN